MVVKWKYNVLKFCLTSFSERTNKVYNRSLFLTNSFLNKRFLVYTGNRFVSILIKDFMLGHKIGEFVLTKRLGRTIHLKNKK